MLNSRKLMVKGFFLAIIMCSSNLSSSSKYAQNESCASRCYECSSDPLYCGAWGIQFDVGIRPITWRHRSSLSLVSCDNPTVPVNFLGSLGHFRSLYRLPWQIGGQLSYALSCNTNVFVEFNYAQAKSKLNCGTNLISCCVSLDDLAINLGKYKLFEGYVGTRYYWERSFCDRVSFFLGGKVGFIHHKRVLFNSLTISDCTLDSPTDTNIFFSKRTALAGGGHIGWDACFCGNWSLVFTAEVVASCGPVGIGNVVLNDSDAFNLSGSNILVGSVGTELAFPLTVGIKYNF